VAAGDLSPVVLTLLGGEIIAGIAIGVATVVYSVLQKRPAPTKAEARARRLRNQQVGQRMGSVMVPISVVIALFSPRGGKVVIMAFLGGFLMPIGIGVLTVVKWSKRQCRLRLATIVRAAFADPEACIRLRCDSACASTVAGVA
jgi:hypothetical protein